MFSCHPVQYALKLLVGTEYDKIHTSLFSMHE
jgi:hypothetical protein